MNKEDMIPKEFVPYEQALALEELGFDEPCLAWFSETKKLQIAPETYKKWTGKPCNNSNIINIFNVDCITAPTFSQAFRWFRDKYNLDIDISRNDQEMIDYVEREGGKYLPKYSYGYSNGTFIRIGTCMKYEEAELACLIKLIEIVKEKK